MRAPLAIALLGFVLAAHALAQEQEGGGFGRDRASVDAVGNLEAYAAYKMAQYDRARELWLALAQGGNTTAMINLANLYAQGQGVPRDPAAAAAWTRKAAELGDSRAQLELGQAYESGEGVERDNREAAHWFKEAALQGDADAAFRLGVMLATAYGRGMAQASPEERAEGARWLEAAARGGHKEAAGLLAALRGDGG
jgi:TPR repeat protein